MGWGEVAEAWFKHCDPGVGLNYTWKFLLKNKGPVLATSQ